jgi:indole-3-glycerol phosphate synthase
MLEEIIKNKRKEIENLRKFSKHRSRPVFDVEIFLKKKPIIAEVKQASPSLGKIKTVNPVEQAQKYADAGAGAISVLTDEKYFKGSLDYLYDVSHNVALPILCKDFILCERQIENAFDAGADFILLMATVLNETELKSLSDLAFGLGMNVLFEIHTLEEFEKLKNINIRMLGINSRDLKTLKINKKKAANLMSTINGNFIKVAESGIDSPMDLIIFKNSGANAFLIGSYLMKSDNIELAMKNLYDGLF